MLDNKSANVVYCLPIIKRACQILLAVTISSFLMTKNGMGGRKKEG